MAKSNKTRYALLGFLSMSPSSGYDIKIYMQQSTSHFWREGDSSIYPILKQLLDEDLLTCELTNTQSDKPKKIYTITKAGQQALEEWLFETPDLFRSRNELMLKVFFGWNVEREVTLGHLRNYQRTVKTRLEQYKSWSKKTSSTKDLANDKLHRFLTLRAGVIYSEAKLTWCEEAIGLLESETEII